MQDGIYYNNCLFYNLQTPFLISGHPRGPWGRSQGTAVWVYSWASRPVDSNLWGGRSRPLQMWLQGFADVTVATVTITANLPRQGLRSPLLHLPKIMLKEQHSFSHFSLAPDNARLCWLAWPAREQPMVGSNPMPVHRRGLLAPLQVDRQVFCEFTYAQNHKHSYWIWSRNTKYVCCLQTWRV